MSRVSRLVSLLGLASSALIAACSSGSTPASSTAAAPALTGNDKEWAVPNKNASATRYSDLGQITADNVKNLKVAWTFSTGVLRGHEGEPIVVNNTMYLATPYPNIVYALDLTKEGAPVKWKYTPKQDPA